MKNKVKTMFVIITAAILISAAAAAYRPNIGALPSGERTERIKASPNYIDGKFRNQTDTPISTSDRSRLSLLWEAAFASKKSIEPSAPLPAVKTNIKELQGKDDLIIWLGHSSVFMRLDGKNILIDPVFGSYASPLPLFNRAYKYDYSYSPADMPEIDCLIISHDHYDHADFGTLKAIKNKIKTVICPLGVGEHLKYWGFEKDIIWEGDWYETFNPYESVKVTVLPARHFSGRFIDINQTLWAGFMLETAERRIFYSGDSGYGPHFDEIGKKFGATDIAIMENGQYNNEWKYIHMTPEETAQAASDVRAKAVLPVHSGRFTLSRHIWNEPYERISDAIAGRDIKLLTPKIGEITYMENMDKSFIKWWK